MEQPKDEFDALRMVVAALEGFKPDESERILRWASEKLKISPAKTSPAVAAGHHSPSTEVHTPPPPTGETAVGQTTDIKTFVDTKDPSSQSQFAATVAYYFMFEAAESNRKEEINSDDLIAAYRLSQRTRPQKVPQTLVNAHRDGYLDKGSERGKYKLNTVGENLVAMVLPEDGNGTSASNQRSATRAKRKSSPKKSGNSKGKASKSKAKRKN